MKDLSQKIIQTIKEEHIKPQARWRVQFWIIALKMLFALFIVFGAVSFALLWYLISELDWDVYSHTNDSLLEFALIAFPHIWIVLFGIFSVIAFRYVRKMELGYRRKAVSIIVLTIALSMGLGSVIYASGIDEKFDKVFQEHIPAYHKIIYTKEKMWSQPDKGLIAGEIQKVEEGSITLKDLNEEQWNIIQDEETLVRQRVLLQKGEEIKVIGEKAGKAQFKAKEIRPWEGRQGHVGQGNQKEGHGADRQMK